MEKSKEFLNVAKPTKIIFRPWDKDQDSTITSTTVGSSNLNLVPINELKKSSEDCDLKSEKMENTSEILSVEEYYGQSGLLTTPPPMMDYTQAMIPPHSFYYPGMPSMIDPFTMGTMEQEYYRVLTEEAQSKLMNMRKQRPKKFKCPHCNVAFSNNGQLKGHIRIHTGERPFKCDDKSCGKTFTRNEELTRHKRIHTGVRPFPCGTCGKRFGRRDHLKKHTKTHFIQEKYLSPALFMPMCPPYIYGF